MFIGIILDNNVAFFLKFIILGYLHYIYNIRVGVKPGWSLRLV